MEENLEKVLVERAKGGISELELKKLLIWIFTSESERKPANTHFTAGAARIIASEFEFAKRKING